MTIKHLLEGAMQYAKAPNCNQFALLTKLEPATVSRMSRNKQTSMRIETLDQIQRTTGAPIEMLLAWYRMPEGARLGRVKEAA